MSNRDEWIARAAQAAVAMLVSRRFADVGDETFNDAKHLVENAIRKHAPKVEEGAIKALVSESEWRQGRPLRGPVLAAKAVVSLASEWEKMAEAMRRQPASSYDEGIATGYAYCAARLQGALMGYGADAADAPAEPAS